MKEHNDITKPQSADAKKGDCAQFLKEGFAELSKPGKNMKFIAGTDADHLATSMLMNAIEAFPKNFTKETANLMVMLGLKELSPQDSMEGMLCAQILALDAQGMRYLARAEKEENLLCHTEAAVNMAIKLLRLKNETIDVLARYRRKGEQKVVVQHINVNDQSKAVIGDIVTGGGAGVKS